MRTITTFQIDERCLRVADRKVDEGARELVAALLQEERLLWPDEPELTTNEVLEAFKKLVAAAGPDGDLPTDPDSRAVVNAVREFLDLPIQRSRRPTALESSLEFDRETGRRYDALRQAVSILAQIPPNKRSESVRHLELIFYARNEGVLGLGFQSGATFTFRLRNNNPDTLKGATQRLAHALAPRSSTDVDFVLRRAHTDALGGVDKRLGMRFEDVEMRTPADELAQIGEVHPVTSQLRLLGYVANSRPQNLLLYGSLFFIVLDFVFEVFVGSYGVRHLDVTKWLAGLVERLITAALGAYLVTVFLRYATLRSQLRSTYERRRSGLTGTGGFGAFIEWRTAKAAPTEVPTL